jgi:outer membrane protein assembly complex protein YaeT
VTGTKRVSPKLVLRQITYKRGEMFDSTQIATSRTKIVGLNLFRSVEFIPQKDPTNPQQVTIEIKVQEKPKHSLNLAVGYNTQSQFNIGAQWNDYNFLGNGRQLSFLAQYSNVVSTVDLKLIQPFFFSEKSSFIGEARAWQEVYQTYTLNAAQLQPRISYQFNPHLTTDFGWRLGYLKFSSLNPQTIAAIGGVRRNGILSGPYADIIWNNTEDPFNPQHGEIATLYANTASHAFGSDYRYWRVLGEVRNYHLLGWQTVLAGRLKLGFEHSYGSIADIPLSERFYSGGEGSVRGYGLRRIGPLSSANQPEGGLSLVEGSLELRRPLFWKIGGSLFFDCGQVSKDQDRVPVDALQCGAGPGVNVNTPVGPMVVDLGFPTKPPNGDSHWQLYFSIGQWF